MEKHTKCIYLIDDDEITNRLNTYTLMEIPYCHEVKAFEDAQEAFNHMNNLKSSDFPHVIFIDYNMPYSSASEIIKKVKDISSNIKTVILTAYINKAESTEITNNPDYDDLIFKPLTLDKIRESFKKMEII